MGRQKSWFSLFYRKPKKTGQRLNVQTGFCDFSVRLLKTFRLFPTVALFPDTLFLLCLIFAESEVSLLLHSIVFLSANYPSGPIHQWQEASWCLLFLFMLFYMHWKAKLPKGFSTAPVWKGKNILKLFLARILDSKKGGGDLYDNLYSNDLLQKKEAFAFAVNRP